MSYNIRKKEDCHDEMEATARHARKTLYTNMQRLCELYNNL